MALNINVATEDDLRILGISKSHAKQILTKRGTQPGWVFTERSFRSIFQNSSACMQLLADRLIWFGPSRSSKTRGGKKAERHYLSRSFTSPERRGGMQDNTYVPPRGSTEHGVYPGPVRGSFTPGYTPFGFPQGQAWGPRAGVPEDSRRRFASADQQRHYPRFPNPNGRSDHQWGHSRGYPRGSPPPLMPFEGLGSVPENQTPEEGGPVSDSYEEHRQPLGNHITNVGGQPNGGALEETAEPNGTAELNPKTRREGVPSEDVTPTRGVINHQEPEEDKTTGGPDTPKAEDQPGRDTPNLGMDSPNRGSGSPVKGGGYTQGPICRYGGYTSASTGSDQGTVGEK